MARRIYPGDSPGGAVLAKAVKHFAQCAGQKLDGYFILPGRDSVFVYTPFSYYDGHQTPTHGHIAFDVRFKLLPDNATMGGVELLKPNPRAMPFIITDHMTMEPPPPDGTRRALENLQGCVRESQILKAG